MRTGTTTSRRCPTTVPLIVVANEFFDALPIRQLVRAGDAWRERMVACQDLLFLPITGKDVPDSIIPEHLRDAAPGSVIETSPASVGIARARRATAGAAQGGAALVIDYGYEGPAIGDTLQAVSGHHFANPFEEPGNRDLTAHVDFATLGRGGGGRGRARRRAGRPGRIPDRARHRAPRRGARQGVARPRRCARRRPRAAVDDDQMGELFKAMAWTSPNWPDPAGFA